MWELADRSRALLIVPTLCVGMHPVTLCVAFKQDAERPLGRWYYSGGALKEPAKLYCDLDYRAVENSVEFFIPGAKLKISHDFGGKKP